MSLVSVIMPYFKKKSFFLESVHSVLNQTYENTEIIIIYDDSNLNDLPYIYAAQKLDSRIKVIVNSCNMGAGLSRNIGILQSKGSYIAFLDCDDFWHKDKLEKQVHFMKTNKVSFSYTSYYIINDKNEIIRKKKFQEKLCFQIYF